MTERVTITFVLDCACEYEVTLERVEDPDPQELLDAISRPSIEVGAVTGCVDHGTRIITHVEGWPSG